MRGAAWRTLAWAIPTLLIVTFLVFLMLDLAPGDPARTIAGPEASPEVVEHIHRELGLDKPLPQRYLSWVAGAIQGDMNQSLVSSQPVSKLVFQAVPTSLSLVAVAMAMSIAIAFLLGVVPLLFRHPAVDRVATFLSALAISMPSFWVALVLVSALALDRSLFPALGYVPLTESPWSWLHHLVLPGLALSLITAGELARQLRGALRDVLDKDYALAARAKGLSHAHVVLKHGLKNAAVPVVTVLGVRVAALLGSTAILEQIFLIDGLGRLTVTAVIARDVPVVLGVVVVATTIVLVINVLIDVSYGYFNPRVRTE